MSTYISSTALHPDGKIPGNELTLRIEDYEDIEDVVVGGGREAADALLANVPMPTPRQVVERMLGRERSGEITVKSRKQTGDLATAISGQARGNAHNAVLRTLQRWADGTRKPTLKTAQKYQMQYFNNTGKRSLGLEKLIRAIEGRADVSDLAAGTLNIIVKGNILPYPGSDDVRNRAVKIVVKPQERLLRIRAFDDPIEVWLEVFHRETDAVLLTCDWLLMEYTEA